MLVLLRRGYVRFIFQHFWQLQNDGLYKHILFLFHHHIIKFSFHCQFIKRGRAGEIMDSCAFEKLFSMSVPHILEKIFFYLDYESYKECLEVSYAWNELLISKSYQKKGKSVFQDELMRDEEKLWIIFLEKDIPHGGDPLTRKIPISTGNLSEVRKILSSGMLDVNSTVGQLGKMMEDPNQSQPNRGPRAEAILDRRLILNYYHDTPLVRASIRGDKVLAEILLHNGANPNVATRKLLRTSLHVAAARDHRDVIELLLDEGGDPNMVQGVPSQLRTGLG